MLSWECWCLWNEPGIPFLLHSFLNFSLVLGMYGTTMVALFWLLSVVLLLLDVLVVLLDCWSEWVNLCCYWLRTQEGNWQCWRAVLMCSSSLSILSWDEETSLALCAKVLKTLCFAVMWWLLCQCKYWSVWVGFLYIVVLKVLSGSMVTRVSKKGSESCCIGSTMNWLCGSWLLICCSRSWLCSALLMTKVSSTNLSQREGVGEGGEGFDFKLFHKDVCYEGADGGSHSCTL